MTVKQSILLSLAILTLVTLLLAIIFGDQGLADLQLLKKKLDVLVQKNKKLEHENLSLYNEIDRLRHDPEFIENVARKELGMIRKDEVIFKLKGQKSADE